MQHNKLTKLYICHVEKNIPIADIRTTLALQFNLPLNNVTINEPNENFKKHKFLVVESSKESDVLNFRNAFIKQGPNNWFIKETPPRNNTIKKTDSTVAPQASDTAHSRTKNIPYFIKNHSYAKAVMQPQRPPQSLQFRN